MRNWTTSAELLLEVTLILAKRFAAGHDRTVVVAVPRRVNRLRLQ